MIQTSDDKKLHKFAAVRNLLWCGFVLCLVSPLVLGCGSGLSAGTILSVSNYAREVLTLTNAERTDIGLPELTWDDTLAGVAAAHAEDMINRDFFAHDNPDGQDVGNRATAAGYLWQWIGENLAAGQQTPAEAVEGWMNSAGHRANILRTEFSVLGVAYRQGGTHGTYWVQVFGDPR